MHHNDAVNAFSKPDNLHFQRNSDISQFKIYHICVESEDFLVYQTQRTQSLKILPMAGQKQFPLHGIIRPSQY